ncbi:diacylglycerol kinase [Limoniibacter endophyticus]|uniref:Diacylglycerol kinase n=1 Tax=Limoniibacter endophyticus TaxID=1565040 RepID=A0A8J3DED2_9HYPH|nr:diacylglycerol kinase [Limoniibacter endophyticus]GHC63074.1 hypothetical protein GCM10010136_04580 [Limoniibacter endophyticus]
MTDKTKNSAFPKKEGLSHLFAALGYSLAGAKRLIRETASRHEIIAFLAALLLFALVRASLFQFLGLIVLFLVLLAIEALNTAIEETVDYISLETAQPAKHAKDLGSLAVFCMLFANGLYILGVIVSRIWV